MRNLLSVCVTVGLLVAASAALAQAPPGGVPQPQPFGPPGGGPGFQNAPNYKELIPALIDALKDSDEEVRHSAAGALASMGQQALPALLEILKDNGKDKELRANVAYTLGLMGAGAQEALPTLTKLLKDDDRAVRRRAAFAIHGIVKASETSGWMGPGMAPGGSRPGGFFPGGFQPGGGPGSFRPPVSQPPGGAAPNPDPGVVPPAGRTATPATDKKDDKKDDKK